MIYWTYLFALFRRLGVARQVLVSLKSEQLKLPVQVWGGPCHGQLQWKEPTYSMVMRRLHNPAYAGAYVYGEGQYDGSHRSPKTGKAQMRARALEDWPVCIQNHHEGYIDWEEYLANQHQLKQNNYFPTTQGVARKGAALLQGLVWCGYCGAKMGVNSHAAREHRRPSYLCSHAHSEGAAHTCQSMTSKPIDDLVVSLFLEALAPSKIKIALQAVEQLQQERQALQHQWEQQLKQARYEAQYAQRQYDAVDPDNRLVASELERRWNDKLEALQTFEKSYAEAQQQSRFTINDQEKQAMENLTQDLPAVWQAETTTDVERKQLLRYAIQEVQLDGVTTPGKITIRVTWYSGAVTERQIDRIKVGIWAPRTDDKVIKRISELASTHTVDEIVECLNQEGLRSAHGRIFRDYHVL